MSFVSRPASDQSSGFSNQQAILALLLVFPVGLDVLGVGFTVLMRPQAQQIEQPKPLADAERIEPRVNPVDLAISTVSQWVQALSDGNTTKARSLMTDGAATRYDPDFFLQFERVTVSDVQASSTSGSYINLNGVMTFIYPDGSTQRETRTFTVNVLSQSQPVLTATEFVSVIKPRY
jgi:hypothetical protein